jgi:hypothetical protein
MRRQQSHNAHLQLTHTDTQQAHITRDDISTTGLHGSIMEGRGEEEGVEGERK